MCAADMSETAQGIGVPHPRVVNLLEMASNSLGLGTEMIILEMINGQSLDVLWPTLSDEQHEAICEEIVKVLVKMFNFRSEYIHSRRTPFRFEYPPYNVHYPDPLLLTPAFDQGPLLWMAPQRYKDTVLEYFYALAQRVDLIFSRPSAGDDDEGTGWPGKPDPTLDERRLIRETWARLKALIPYHTGGFYVPASLSPEAHEHLMTILQSKTFGLCHSDLSMSRIVVDMSGSRPKIYITGWEHVYFAPLWSCARIPTWMQPKARQRTPLPITVKQQEKMSRMLYRLMKAASRDWVFAYAYGEMERYFEQCLNAHWMCRDGLEMALRHIKARWEKARPDIPFPVTLPDHIEHIAIPDDLDPRSTLFAPLVPDGGPPLSDLALPLLLQPPAPAPVRSPRNIYPQYPLLTREQADQALALGRIVGGRSHPQVVASQPPPDPARSLLLQPLAPCQYQIHEADQPYRSYYTMPPPGMVEAVMKFEEFMKRDGEQRRAAYPNELAPPPLPSSGDYGN
ncbi:hypothetical protein BKA93DRAFT_198784 [Sparassis latifolia]